MPGGHTIPSQTVSVSLQDLRGKESKIRCLIFLDIHLIKLVFEKVGHWIEQSERIIYSLKKIFRAESKPLRGYNQLLWNNRGKGICVGETSPRHFNSSLGEMRI